MSQQLDANIRAKWKANDIIRNVHSGNPFLVLQVFKLVSTMLADLTLTTQLQPALVLLPRDYDDYEIDYKIDRVISGDIINWKQFTQL